MECDFGTIIPPSKSVYKPSSTNLTLNPDHSYSPPVYFCLGISIVRDRHQPFDCCALSHWGSINTWSSPPACSLFSFFSILVQGLYAYQWGDIRDRVFASWKLPTWLLQVSLRARLGIFETYLPQLLDSWVLELNSFQFDTMILSVRSPLSHAITLRSLSCLRACRGLYLHRSLP